MNGVPDRVYEKNEFIKDAIKIGKDSISIILLLKLISKHSIFESHFF